MRQPQTAASLVVWTNVVATAFLTVAPGLVGGFIDHLHLTPGDAGMVAAGHLAGMLIGSAAALIVLNLSNLRRLLGIVFAAMIAAELASAFAADALSLVVLQAVAGTGAGLAMAASFVMASASPRPDARFGWMLAGQMVFGALAFTGLPWLLSEFGTRGAFVTLAILPTSTLLLLSRYPQRTSSSSTSSRLPPWSRLAPLAAASLLVHYVANTAVWTYTDRIGVDGGLSVAEVGFALGISMLAGLAGATLATFAASRGAGTAPCIVGGIGAIIVGTSLYFFSGNYAAFIAATALCLASIMFTVPFYLGLLARLDPQGRWVIIGNLIIGLGLAAGPAIGSRIVAEFGYSSLLGSAIAAFVLAVLLVTAGLRTKGDQLGSLPYVSRQQ